MQSYSDWLRDHSADVWYGANSQIEQHSAYNCNAYTTSIDDGSPEILTDDWERIMEYVKKHMKSNILKSHEVLMKEKEEKEKRELMVWTKKMCQSYVILDGEPEEDQLTLDLD